MGEYSATPGAFVRDFGDGAGERSPVFDPMERILGDEATDKNLEFINELRRFHISDLELPQLVVIGDQSVGKSSVLQAITGIPFPVNEGMCTRFATEVSLHRSPPGCPITTSLSVRVASEHRQRRIDEWESHNGRITNELDPQAFARLLNEASGVIVGSRIDESVLDDVTLCISQTGPDKANLTIVDLPGLVSANHESHNSALSLVRKYVDNPKSIVLVVLQPSDRATQYAHQMLQSIHNKKDRVIGVINKCDNKNPGDHRWIFDYIVNEETNSEYLNEGWFGLRNRRKLEQGISDRDRDQKEAELFNEPEWIDLGQPGRLGISNLRRALTKMLNAHIARSIPTLIPEIKTRIEDCDSQLKRFGEPRTETDQQLNCMMTLATNFSKLSTDALNGNYHRLPPNQNAKICKIYQETLEKLQESMINDRDVIFNLDSRHDFPQAEEDADFDPNRREYTLLRSNKESEWKENVLERGIFREIYNAIRENRGREFPEEVNNPCVPNMLWNGKTRGWKDRATAVIENFTISIGRAMGIFFEAVCADEDLRESTRTWLGGRLHEVANDARKELNKIIADEAKATWTVNPQRTKQVVKLQQKRMAAMMRELEDLEAEEDENEGEGEHPEEEYEDAETRIKSWLNADGVMAAVFSTHDKMVAYYNVAMNRFIDNIGLQVLERHMLGEKSPLNIFNAQYVVDESRRDPTFLERVAGERVDRRVQRDAWTSRKVALERALQTARDYGYSG